MRVDRGQRSAPAPAFVPEVELSVSPPPSSRGSSSMLATPAVNGSGAFNGQGAQAQGSQDKWTGNGGDYTNGHGRYRIRIISPVRDGLSSSV